MRSERLLMKQLNYSLLFRWFVGLNIDDPCGVTRPKFAQMPYLLGHTQCLLFIVGETSEASSLIRASQK